MDINNALLNNIEMYSHGKMNFIIGLCEQLNLPEVFNKTLKKLWVEILTYHME